MEAGEKPPFKKRYIAIALILIGAICFPLIPALRLVVFSDDQPAAASSLSRVLGRRFRAPLAAEGPATSSLPAASGAGAPFAPPLASNVSALLEELSRAWAASAPGDAALLRAQVEALVGGFSGGGGGGAS